MKNLLIVLMSLFGNTLFSIENNVANSDSKRPRLDSPSAYSVTSRSISSISTEGSICRCLCHGVEDEDALSKSPCDSRGCPCECHDEDRQVTDLEDDVFEVPGNSSTLPKNKESN